MKNLNLLIALIVSALLSACTGKSNGSGGNDPSPQAGHPTTPTTAGTGDSAGGNLYNGKPLESYIQKPMDLSAYKNIVQKVVDAAIPDVQFPMKYILESKAWYFVPGPLSALPPEQIGSVVPTEQGALQNFTQVWIDQDLFAKMSEADQAKLLLHEVLMGFKLLKFESPRNACSALFYGTWTGRQSECDALSATKTGKVSDLSPLDYDDIRHTTSFLLETDLSTLSQPIDWRTVFNKGNFHFYTMYYISKDQVVETTYKKTLTEAKISLDSGYQPKFGFSMAALDAQAPGWKRDQPIPDGFIWKSSSSCQIDLVLKNDSNYHLKIQIGDYQIETDVSSSNEDFNHALNYFWANGDLLWQKDLSPFIGGHPPSSATPNQRKRLDRIVGLFDNSNNLKMITVQEWYIREFANSFSSNWSAFDDDILHGDYFVCSVAPEIKFQRKPNTPKGYW